MGSATRGTCPVRRILSLLGLGVFQFFPDLYISSFLSTSHALLLLLLCFSPESSMHALASPPRIRFVCCGFACCGLVPASDLVMEMELASPVAPMGRSVFHHGLQSVKREPWLPPAKRMPSTPLLSPTWSSSSSTPRSVVPFPSSRDVARMFLMMNNGKKSAIAGSGKNKPTKNSTCVCAPTSHPGSFRCRSHRAAQVKAAWMPPSSSYSSPTSGISLGTPNPIIAAASAYRRRVQKATGFSRFCPLNRNGDA